MNTATSNNFFIQNDRLSPPSYPEWVREAKHPELESRGPVQYDARRLEKYFHPEQQNATVEPKVIYDHLQQTDLLWRCLDAHDLEEIRLKGLEFYEEVFGNVDKVYAWKSVVVAKEPLKSGEDFVAVQFLSRSGNELKMYARLLTYKSVIKEPIFLYP